MICDECKNKSLARGFRVVKCKYCGQQCTPNCFYKIDICEGCSNTFGICQYCGKPEILETKLSKEELNQIVDKLCNVSEIIKVSVDDLKIAIEKISNNIYKNIKSYVGKTGTVETDYCYDEHRLVINFDNIYMNTLDKENGKLCFREKDVQILTNDQSPYDTGNNKEIQKLVNQFVADIITIMSK
jgi:hypothetical protein